MHDHGNKQAGVSLEDVDAARSAFRIYAFRLLTLCVVGIGGSVWLFFRFPNIMIAGYGLAEWLMIITGVTLVVLMWRVAYQVSRLINISLFVAITSGPLLSMYIGMAAAKLGYKVGPFYGSLQPMPPDTGMRRFGKFIANGIAIVILGAAVILIMDAQGIPLPRWVTDVYMKPQNIAIDKSIQKSPINMPGYNQHQLQRVAAITALYDRANYIAFDHFMTNTSYITNPATGEERTKYREMLSQSWEIDSRVEVLKTFSWLKKEGQQQQFSTMAEALNDGQASSVLAKNEADPVSQHNIQVVRDNYKQLGKNGIIAWDLVRLAYVAQASYYAGYISREEAWKEMIYAATTTQQAFSSWNEMAHSFLVGREFWNGEKDTRFSELATWLTTNEDSPWVKNKWDTSLQKVPQ